MSEAQGLGANAGAELLVNGMDIRPVDILLYPTASLEDIGLPWPTHSEVMLTSPSRHETIEMSASLPAIVTTNATRQRTSEHDKQTSKHVTVSQQESG